MTRIIASILTVMSAVVWAQAPASQGEEKPKLSLQLSGFYEFNGYTQNNFFFGARPSGVVTDHDDYAVQLLRLQTEFAYGPNLKAVMRADFAQGIWGIDDQYRDNFRPGFSNLFNNKDTNFFVHVDWAYVEFNAAKLGNTTIRLGRMKNALGHLLVLDQDGDGVQVAKKLGDWQATFFSPPPSSAPRRLCVLGPMPTATTRSTQASSELPAPEIWERRWTLSWTGG